MLHAGKIPVENWLIRYFCPERKELAEKSGKAFVFAYAEYLDIFRKDTIGYFLGIACQNNSAYSIRANNLVEKAGICPFFLYKIKSVLFLRPLFFAVYNRTIYWT